MKKFSESHEWISIEKNHATVGISKVAKDQLGSVVYLELPKVGETIHANEEVCLIESDKSACDIYAPLSGKVIEVNEKLKTNPKLINESPEEKGWLFKMTIKDPKELDRLMDEHEYEAYVS